MCFNYSIMFIHMLLFLDSGIICVIGFISIAFMHMLRKLNLFHIMNLSYQFKSAPVVLHHRVTTVICCHNSFVLYYKSFQGFQRIQIPTM